METKLNIEENVKAALETAKKIQPSELSAGFSERVITITHHSPFTIHHSYSYSLLRVAAMFVLIIANVWTLRLLFISQPKQNQPTLVSIRDFVNDYQMNDANEEVLTANNTKQ